MKNFIVAACVILSTVLTARPQESYMKIADNFSSGSLGSGENMVLPIKWIDPSGRYVCYTENIHGIESYRLTDNIRKKNEILFDNASMAVHLIPFSDDGNLPDADHLKIRSLKFPGQSPDFFTFEFNGKTLGFDRVENSLTEIPESEEVNYTDDFWERDYSPDSLFYLTIGNHDLILSDKEGNPLRLTDDSEPYHTFLLDDPSSEEGIGTPTGCWIGDSHKYLCVREDKRHIGEISIIRSRKSPVAHNSKYVCAGDKEVVHQEIFLVDAEKKEAKELDVRRFLDQKIEIPQLEPFQMTAHCAFFTRQSRTCDSLELCCVDIRTDSVRTVIQEICKPHLNVQLFNYRILAESNEILWWSERTGKGQYFLYDLDGRLLRQLTDDSFVAGPVKYIDTSRRFMIIEGYGFDEKINPHYRQYFKVPLEGGKTICLTPDDGNHSLSIAPEGRFIYDRWSRMDLPEQRCISDLKGRHVMDLPAADISEQIRKGWKAPELVQLMAADSVTKLYGVVFLPFDLDPEKKYPIITNVYPGPQEDQVPLSFSFDSNENMRLAQLGFIVIQFSHRGSSPLRGKEYYNYGYGNLRDYAIEDDMAIIRQIAERYPFADIDKVGIYGHSGGGFMTATAMLEYPDFYKVGIAASGNHDNNIYFQSWGETYHGVKLVQEADGSSRFECKIPTNIELAGNLKGRLLLVHGEVDDNVHPASTLRLADALIKAGKRFDMMIIPDADHGLPIRYYNNMVRYYFVENLLGLKQDDINIIEHR